MSDSCQITPTIADEYRPESLAQVAWFLASGYPPPTETPAGQNCHAGGRGFGPVAPVLSTALLMRDCG